MANIKVIGDAVVITSAMTLEALRTIAKYRPSALVLKGGEDGKEPIFAIGVGSTGSINCNGATFASESHDDAKLATITMFVRGVTGDVREAVAEQYGTAIINLNKLEATLPAVLDEINAEKATVLSNITVG